MDEETRNGKKTFAECAGDALRRLFEKTNREPKSLQEIMDEMYKTDALALQIQMVSGFTLEKLLEMFMAGYTLEPPERTGEQFITDFLSGKYDEA